MGSSKLRVLLFGLVIGILQTGVASMPSHASPCPSQRPRSPEQTRYLFEMLTWQLGRQGTTVYEGKHADKRPIPELSLRDFAKIRERELRGSAFGNLPDLGESLYFTFHKTRFRASEAEVIHIPKPDLWCMVRPGDWVVLSDGAYTHITFVFHVDRQNQRILFLDLWPDEFFLKAGENALGVEAQVFDYTDFQLFDAEGQRRESAGHAWPVKLDTNQLFGYLAAFQSSEKKRLVSISRREYLRVIMGLTAIDTPEIYDFYRELNQETAARPEVQRSFALTYLKWPGERFRLDLLEWPDEPFIGPAVALSKAALDSVDRDSSEELNRRTSHTYTLASLIDVYRSIEHGDKAAGPAVRKDLDGLRAKLDSADLARLNTPQDYYRVGVAAMRARFFDHARTFFTQAIAAHQDYIDAFLSRASVDEKSGSYAQVLSDMTKALEIIGRARALTAKRRAERHPRDLWGQSNDDHELEVSDWHKAIALGLRSGAFGVTGDFERSLEDAKALIEVRRDLSKGYGLAGQAEISLGMVALSRGSAEAAKQHLIAANRYFQGFLEKERDARTRAAVIAAMKESAAPLAHASSGGVEFFNAYREAMTQRNRDRALSLVASSPLTARIVAEDMVKKGQQALNGLTPDAAFGAYSIALNILEQIEDEVNVGLVSNDLAIAYWMKGENHAALAAARRALDIFQRHKLTDAEKAAEDTLGRIQANFPDRESLKAFLIEHLRYAKEKGYRREHDMTLRDLQRLEAD